MIFSAGMSRSTEAVVGWCSMKKVFLKISQNLQENTLCQATLLKKELWHMCFPVNFTKLLRILILI